MSGDRGYRGSGSAVVRLTVRLIRRSTLLTALALAAYAAVETLVIERSYPDDASRAALSTFGDFPMLRVLQGVPYSVDTGALVAWDAGWVMSLVVGLWAITTTARVLRGDEDEGRAEVMLAGPVRASRMLACQVCALLAAGGVLGLSTALAMVASGAPVAGSLLFGAAICGLCAAFVALTAVASQVFASRRQALGVSAGLLGAALVLRMVANSADSRSWLAWVTPLGWIDQLRPFGEDRVPVLLVPVAVVAGLVACAIALLVRRDSRTGLVRERGARPSHAWGLTSPMAFAWRANLGVLLMWALALAVWGAATGALVPSMNDFVDSDPAFRDILAGMGMEVSDLSKGFVGMTATIVGVALSVYAASRVGSAREEEATTRLDHVTTRSVPRRRWLGGQVLLTLVSVLLLAVVAGGATWGGAAMMGADLSAGDSMAAVLNTFPVAVVFGGLAVLVFGLAPRATVAVAASAAVLAYVLQLVGPALGWPDIIVGASPFWHLTAVPVEAFEPVSAVVLVALGAFATAVGMVAFERRDLVGA